MKLALAVLAVMFTSSVALADDELPEQLSPDAVLTTITKHYTESLNRCFARAVRADKKASGKLSITLHVAADGHVETAIAKGSTAVLHNCVTTQMKGWKFGAAQTGSAFQFTITLAVN